MLRIPLVVFVLSTLLWSCSSSDSGDSDAAVDKDGVVNGDSLPGDRAPPDVQECVQSATKCPAGLSCRCCGSIGPDPICICTAQCYENRECLEFGFAFCNMAEGAKSGICTPVDFNCCWDCQ